MKTTTYTHTHTYDAYIWVENGLSPGFSQD